VCGVRDRRSHALVLASCQTPAQSVISFLADVADP